MDDEPTANQYGAAAEKLLRRSVGIALVSHMDCEHNGELGRWVYYGRNKELRLWVPRVYAMMIVRS